ncbi:DnaJ domain-containing protein [bacterium]|nr:DnaJ domain-containing protein [bacterium]
MGILRVLSGLVGGASLKRAADLLRKGKTEDALRMIEKLAEQMPSPPPEDKIDEYAELHAQWGRCLAKLKDPGALEHYQLSHQAKHNESLLREGAILIEEMDLVSPEATDYILDLAKHTADEKGFLLSYAKKLVGDGDAVLTDTEFELVVEASKAFTLWKGGSSLIADRFLSQGREDDEAVEIYRIAYPTRKHDEKLVEILLKHLIANNERSDFAAKLYRDLLEAGRENDDALRLLAEYYVEQHEITPGTVGYIDQALEKKLPRHDILENLAAYLLRTRKEFLDKKRLLLLVFRAGYFNKNVLAFLAQAFAEEGNFSNEALMAYEEALKNNLLTKRITLVLTEHFLSEDRRDEFACKVYEHYLGSWPERRTPRLYSLLAATYVEKKRIDEQAQVIYEKSLVHDATNTDILPLLAASYLTFETRQPKAYSVYERAFPYISDTDIRNRIALLMAEHRIEDGNYDKRTLEYIELALQSATGTRKEKLHEARTKCFLTLNRRDKEAVEIYLELYKKLGDARTQDVKLIGILSDILIEQPEEVAAEENLRRQIFYERFESEKFSCPANIAFYLLDHVLNHNQEYKYRLHLAVRCLEADSARLADELKKAGELDVLQQIGHFYLERYNYELAARAYSVANEYHHTEENDYQLAKIRLYEDKTEQAFALLDTVKSQEKASYVLYWRAAAYQQENKPEKASPLIKKLELDGDAVPEVLIKLRKGLNAELLGDYGDAVELYNELLENPGGLPYRRWVDIEIGLALWRMGATAEARRKLGEVYRYNPNGRAEQRNYSYILVLHGYEQIQQGEWDDALNSFLESVEANRNDRMLRSVIVELLVNYAKRFFFDSDYEMAVKILEVAHRILPKSIEAKIYLAYSYHLLNKYSQALIYYRDITWTTDMPTFERSQAYCYLQNKQTRKAWRVFLDLKRRGTLIAANIPLLLDTYLADEEQEGSETFKEFEFPEDAKSPIPFAAFYIHDGQYERALDLLTKHAKGEHQTMQRLWFQGKAAAKKGDRTLAITYWKQLLDASQARQTHDETKLAQLLEIGLAFLEAGYAQEAMETWEDLKKFDENFQHLPKLWAYTLNLNAYTLAQKGNIKLAIAEWEKATEYDPDNLAIIQNVAIAHMSVEDFDLSALHWRRLMNRWRVMVERDPQSHAHLTVAIGEVERLLSDVFVVKTQEADEVYIAKTEEMVDYYRRANEFYWILGLDKTATKGQIEKSYFRLVKIFDPERHASDFMLLEDAYANLTDQHKRERIDIFAYNPVDAGRLRQMVLGDRRVSSVFEDLNLRVKVPGPDYSQLEPDDTPPETIIAKLADSIQIYFKLGDISVL